METPSSLNILGTQLSPCWLRKPTGFCRDGYCRPHQYDAGNHVVCAVITEEFLRYTGGQGNDLVTPRPEYSFPGLEAGDRWCLCALRWKEAYIAGVAPPIVAESTHEDTLKFIDRDILFASLLKT